MTPRYNAFTSVILNLYFMSLIILNKKLKERMWSHLDSTHKYY